MTPGDHSADLERIAKQTGQSPLEIFEFFNERAGIRQECMSRDEAEKLAVEDCRAYFTKGTR